ncbi:MAG: GWxTD domain-containing protein, partial [bacterium]|nr:GWxTD domain-containing protein [bacterium]
NPVYSQTDHYTKGKEALDSGAWVKALNLWEYGKKSMEAEGQSDPRIGIAYIDLVTKEEKEFFYEKAGAIYLWGFSGLNVGDHKDAVIEEANRIIPLLEEEEKKRWKDLLNGDIRTLSNEIVGFWIKSDLTPTSEINERLLEHWERINYSRKSFTANDYCVYGSDDRGLVYVKYGEPALARNIRLGGSSTIEDFAAWDIEDPELIKDLQTELRGMSGLVVWVYRGLYNDRTVPYLFGRASYGSWGLLNGPEDIIDKRFFRKSNLNESTQQFDNADQARSTGRKLFTRYPGFYIMLRLYDRLQVYDSQFAERFNDLVSLEAQMQSEGITSAASFNRNTYWHYVAQNQENVLQRYAPQEISDIEDKVVEIDILAKQIRLLDDQNRSKLAVLAVSTPGVADSTSISKITSGGAVIPDFKVKHTLMIRDGNWKEITRIEDVPESGLDNTSVYLIDHVDSSLNYIMTAGINDDGNQNVNDDLPLKERFEMGEIVYLGRSALDKVSPLNEDFSKLEISDLVTGITITDDLEIGDYPFPVLPVDQIVQGDNLQTYVEVYHLVLGTDRTAKYNISYIIAPYRKGIRMDEMLSNTSIYNIISQEHTFTSPSSTAKEMIEFDISGLKPDEYIFIVEIKDLNSNQNKIRTGKFKIMESK